MARKKYVVLVDKNDRRIGVEEKLKAHLNGRWHRAFSVFVFNRKGETMLQQRAMGIYHSGGRWTNTCCSHPMPGEKVLSAAHRRLREEMGFDCRMWKVFEFPYEADVGNGLREREYDHVIFGFYEKAPKLNRNEAQDWRWISLKDLKSDLKRHPGRFTPWLRMMINEVAHNYSRMRGSISRHN